MSYTLKKDRTEPCAGCLGDLLQGDEVDNEGDSLRHKECAEAAPKESRVDWNISAESLDRIEWEDREERRIAPLGKQGKCPRCFIELPATGICDDDGRP